MHSIRERLNRRHFIHGTAAAAVATAWAVSPLARTQLLAATSKQPANSRINVGCIGAGPQGIGDMQGFLTQSDVRVMAVCDVKEPQRQQARQRVEQHYRNKDCSVCEDFREVIERKDIDAVLVATPDHWHVPISIAALRAGKAVYMEKPMGCSLAEDQALRKVVRKTGMAFQFGTQQRSDRNFRFACELVRNGLIGQLKHINVWAPGSAPGGSTRVTPPPAGLNYDFWLGPAPFRPHTEDRCLSDGLKKTWWFESDYTLGFITGWGIHPMDIAVWGGAHLLDGRAEIEGHGNYPTEGTCNTATTWDLRYRFESGITLSFVGVPNGGNAGKSTGEAWPHETEWKKRYGEIASHGTAFEGTEGWVLINRGRLATHPESLANCNPEGFKVRLKSSQHHVRDFIDSIRSKTQPVCGIEDAFRADALCQVGEIAARSRRKLVFDFRAETFVSDAEANRKLELRSMRKPWRI